MYFFHDLNKLFRRFEYCNSSLKILYEKWKLKTSFYHLTPLKTFKKLRFFPFLFFNSVPCSLTFLQSEPFSPKLLFFFFTVSLFNFLKLLYFDAALTQKFTFEQMIWRHTEWNRGHIQKSLKNIQKPLYAKVQKLKRPFIKPILWSTTISQIF